MKRSEVIKKIIEIISTQDDIREAWDLACENDIFVSEVWNENDEEIIGYAIEDDIIYI